MNYIPQLKYVFCVPRVYQMTYQLPLYRYMNGIGIAPRILAGDEDVVKHLNDNGIFFENLQQLPNDYDILLSLTTGFMSFSRYWLQQSINIGKINLWAFLTPLPMIDEIEAFMPEQTRFLHGVCAPDKRTIDNVKRYNKEVLFLNTGMPAWDRFSTPEFKENVIKIKSLFGEKLLLLAFSGEDKEKVEYYQNIIGWAKSFGFNVILQVHPGLEDKLPDRLTEYANPGFDRYALFAASSHIIGFIFSTLISDCIYLDRRVGFKPFGQKPDKKFWGDFHWYDNPEQWYQDNLPSFGKEYFDKVPLVHDEDSLIEFLSSEQPFFAQDDIDRIFGWPKVASYSEYFFQVMEQYFGLHNAWNVKKILKKTEIEKNVMVDFMWGGERESSPVKHITDMQMLIKTGLNFLKQGNIGAAMSFLRRSETISGIEHFDFVQYAKATCYYLCNNIEEARKHIYRALFIQPGCKTYQELKNRIDAKTNLLETVPV